MVGGGESWLLARGSSVRCESSDVSLAVLDPEILRHHLLRGLYYLHSQPPLYNLFVGIVLKAAPEKYVAVFFAINLALGLIFELSVFWLPVRLDVSRVTAAVTAGLFVATPDFVLYENGLPYSFMVASLVTLSAVLLVEFLRSRQAWAVAGFFVVLFLLCGIRSLFHLGFFLLLAAALALALSRPVGEGIALRGHSRPVADGHLREELPGLRPITASTWLGLNAWTMTTRNLAEADRKELIRRGVLTPVSLVDRESPLEEFPASYRDVSAFPQVLSLLRCGSRRGPPI